VRAGNSGGIGHAGGRRVCATPAATVRGQFTTADVSECLARNAGAVGGSIRARGRGGGERGGGVSVVANGTRKVERIEAIGGREADRDTERGLRIRLEVVQTTIHIIEGGVHRVDEGALGCVFKIHWELAWLGDVFTTSEIRTDGRINESKKNKASRYNVNGCRGGNCNEL
jgi:hypothetical protein